MRLPRTASAKLWPLLPVMGCLAAGAMAGAAWGASRASRLSRVRFEQLILVLLVAVGLALAVEAFIPWRSHGLPLGYAAPVVAVALGSAIGVVGSLLGVAGGELIIPSLVFVFGADVKVAGTASVMISLPMVVVGLVRYVRAGSIGRSDLVDLVLPMGIGSVLGATVGGYLVPLVPSEALKLGLGIILIASAVGIFRHRPTLCIATTSSAQDSGILAELLRKFARESWCRPTVLAVGSGKALELLESGRAHIALTHAPRREHEAHARGSIREPLPVMKNPYVIVGPPDMRHILVGARDAFDGMRRVASSGLPFVSRGDDSGTHERELELWRRTGLPEAKRTFITYARAGMASSLRLASEMRAFALCDRATFVKFEAELDLEILYEGNGELDNVYSLILAARSPDKVAVQLAEFLRSDDARGVLSRYRRDASREPLFVPAT